MKKLIGSMIFLTLFAIATSATCNPFELAKMLESREFWSSYSWGRFDDSALYKATQWKMEKNR